MNNGQIIFAVIYLALLVCYFFSETSGNLPRRAVNKILLATMFFVYFLVTFISDDRMNGYGFIVVAAFVFAWLGDVLLLFSFKKGGISFMLCNVSFFVYEIFLLGANGITFSNVWWATVIFVVPVGLLFTAYFTKKVDFGEIGLLMPIYVLSVSLHGSLGIALSVELKEIRYVLFGLGLALFMVSDYFLTTHKFIRKKNWVLRCNSGTYFAGMLLAAMSFSF